MLQRGGDSLESSDEVKIRPPPKESTTAKKPDGDEQQDSTSDPPTQLSTGLTQRSPSLERWNNRRARRKEECRQRQVVNGDAVPE
jgi:hypothetical protein